MIKSCQPFDCGNEDLNNFFSKDSVNYSSQLLGKSYCFVLDANSSVIVCAFTIANDSIKSTNLPNARKKRVIKNIPRQKQMRSYPAVLIGRLAVNLNFRHVRKEEKRTGDQMMDFIKTWFVDGQNKTGCRYIVVDAYNETGPIHYYQKNGFMELFSTEEQEKEYSGLSLDAPLPTRLLYFDLIMLFIRNSTQPICHYENT